MTNSMENPHVVVVPFPALGHSIPFLEFVKRLASHGVIISYVTSPANMSCLQSQMDEALSFGLDIRLIVLPLPLVQGLPKGVESFDLVPTESCGLVFELADKLEEPFNRWLEQQFEKEVQGGTGPPVCIIHDALIGWTVEGAKKLNIPTVVFSTYGAFGLSLLHSAWLSASQNALQKEGDGLVLSLDLPSPLRLHEREIDSQLFVPLMIEIIGRLKSIRRGCGMLVNTFQELEPEYLQHLKDLTGKPVWPVGPMLPPNFFRGTAKANARGKVADISEEELVHWLDSRSPRSVVYISFGSQTFLSEEQSHVLARGLESSQQSFIWSIKVSPKIEQRTACTTAAAADVARTYLPEGFKERIKDRGLVIWGWVPQLVVLSHPSVGAFMSHCGWNSMVESMALGVPLITWPMYADQHFNSKQAVELGMGLQVCEHRDGIPEIDRVKEAVNLVLKNEKGKKMKIDAEKLKEMTRKAVACGGSSEENLQDFVIELYKLKEVTRKAVAWSGAPRVGLHEDFLNEVHQLST